jgi:hypothetical protein
MVMSRHKQLNTIRGNQASRQACGLPFLPNHSTQQVQYKKELLGAPPRRPDRRPFLVSALLQQWWLFQPHEGKREGKIDLRADYYSTQKPKRRLKKKKSLVYLLLFSSHPLEEGLVAEEQFHFAS